MLSLFLYPKLNTLSINRILNFFSGMMSGVIGGCICGIIAWLVYASQYEGGLAAEHFINNTGKVTPNDQGPML